MDKADAKIEQIRLRVIETEKVELIRGFNSTWCIMATYGSPVVS